MKIARAGWGYLAVLALVTLVVILLEPRLAPLPLAVLLFVAYFFRDPERSVPSGDHEVVSPADGRVMYVREVEEPRFMGGKALLVSIFLSIFDVHINRSPVAGEVTYKEYVKGRFEAAWVDRVEEINERQYIGLQAGPHKVLVAQIAGLVARRIVTWTEVGQPLAKGERFGLIKFGSCTQVYLPLGSEVTVKAGDRVVGGVTPIGRLPQ